MSQPHPDSAVLEPRSTSEPRRVLGISGSLRRDSYNRLLLRAAARAAPHRHTLRRILEQLAAGQPAVAS
jgi:hypothetical protein